MKLISIFIALAMVTMLMEGCARLPEDGQSVSQKLDRAIQQTTLTIADAGDRVGTTLEQSKFEIASVASSLSENALLNTLAVSDSAINAAIKTDLVRDPALRASSIEVDTQDGVVSLTGLTDDIAMRDRAERIARTNRSVIQVTNNLGVRSF